MTQDELAALQKACGIPHTPTPFTAELRLAVSGSGPRAYDWTDKPHRLLYDACAEIERLNNLIDTGKLVLIDDGAVERVVDAIEDAGRGYSINLVRLVDGEATYDLTYRGETTQHPSHADALEALHELARQEKITAALAALGVK